MLPTNYSLTNNSYKYMVIHRHNFSEYCDDTHSARPLHQHLRNHFNLGRWSSVSDRGIAHFFMATRNTIKGLGERTKNKRRLGLTQVQEGWFCDTLHSSPLCICRLTLARNFYKATRNTYSTWLVFPHCCWTLSHATDLSDVRGRLPLPAAFSEILCPTPWLVFSSYFQSRRDLEYKPFVWLRAKTDKGIVFLADHLHSVTVSQLFHLVRVAGHFRQWLKPT